MKKESGIWPTLSAIANSGVVRDFCAKSGLAVRRPRRTKLTATNDCPGLVQSLSTSRTSMPGSFRFVLFLQLAEDFFGLLHIFQCELAGFDQAGHHRLRASAE